MRSSNARGGSKLGKPCDRLIAPVSAASWLMTVKMVVPTSGSLLEILWLISRKLLEAAHQCSKCMVIDAEMLLVREWLLHGTQANPFAYHPPTTPDQGLHRNIIRALDSIHPDAFIANSSGSYQAHSLGLYYPRNGRHSPDLSGRE